MDHMSLEVAVDGSNEEDEEGDHLAPPSVGSYVRKSSARSTGSSRSEKSSSPEEVTSAYKEIYELLKNLQYNWDTRQKALQDKLKELDRKIQQVQQMARECGADESTPDIWIGVLEIIHSERATKFFMEADPVRRMAIIKHYARLHECQDLGGSQPRDIQSKKVGSKKKTAEDSEEEWEDEFFNMFLGDNNAAGFS